MTTATVRSCAALLTALLIAAGVCSPRTAAAKILKMNHQFPEETVGSQIDQWFADRIRTRTGGALEIRIFWANGLGEPRDNLSLLERGVLDMAAMSPGYFPDELPLLAAPNSIPMAMDNICQASRIMQTILDEVPSVRKEAYDLGIRPVFFHVLNPYLLITRRPVRTFDDFKGMRIRTWGNEIPELFRSAGARPVPLFLPDIYKALEQEVIDGCPFSLDLVIAYDIHKIAGHITDVVIWEGPSWGVWISESAWSGLSSFQKTVFLQTAEEARSREIERNLQAEADARKELTSYGIQFHHFPEMEMMKWKAVMPSFLDEFIHRMTGIGKGEAAKKMVDIWRSLRKETGCHDTDRAMKP